MHGSSSDAQKRVDRIEASAFKVLSSTLYIFQRNYVKIYEVIIG